MTETLTLAHFSDVHLPPAAGWGPGIWPRYLNAKRALGLLNWHLKRKAVHNPEIAARLIADAVALRADHLAITGDLINLGLPGEYETALAWLQAAGPAHRVTVVPGNHDIYSSLHGDAGVARWAAYMGAEAESLAFPFVRRIGPIALIGLNSAIETPPFVASGRLGPDQIDVAGDLLQRLGDDGVIRVVLIHHPPLPGLATSRRCLRDAAHFARMLEKSGAELVLYGHNHQPLTTWLAARAGAIPVVAAASVSAAVAYKEESLASYNLFTFFKSGQGLRIRHTLRGLETPGGPVVKLSERVLEQG